MPAGFGVARVLVLHLLVDRAHFLCNDTVAHRSPLGVGHNGVIRSLKSIEMGLQAVGKRGSQRLVGFALREIESFSAVICQSLSADMTQSAFVFCVLAIEPDRQRKAMHAHRHPTRRSRKPRAPHRCHSRLIERRIPRRSLHGNRQQGARRGHCKRYCHRSSVSCAGRIPLATFHR